MRSFLVVFVIGLLACISAVSARPAFATHKIVYANDRVAAVLPPRNGTATNSTATPANATAPCDSSLYPIAHIGEYTLANCTLDFNTATAACKKTNLACRLAAADRRATCEILCHPPKKSIAECSQACAKNWGQFHKDICKPIKEPIPGNACVKIAKEQLTVCQHVCAGLAGNRTVTVPPNAVSFNVTRQGGFGGDNDTSTDGSP
ncbi:hypothetical protein HDU86_008188 [Geranomyces michiganensis]|nr:hypothetical protein HDU86_008188 [Geranomyces michiganensis]